MHTYIDIYTCIYIYTYIHLCICTYIQLHTYIYTYIYIYLQAFLFLGNQTLDTFTFWFIIKSRPSLAYKRHKLISTMCTMKTYHRNPQPTHAHTESAKSCMQTSQTNQHEEALGTMCTMKTCQRNRDTCPYTGSMSLLHPPITLLLKALTRGSFFNEPTRSSGVVVLCRC